MHQGKKVRLEFFGHSYYLSQPPEEEVDLREIVSYVEGVAGKITSEHPSLPAHKQIVLTVLSVAKDYFTAKKELTAFQQRVEGLLTKLPII